MGKKANLIGKKFGKLYVVSECGKNKYGKILWLCKCDCGSDMDIITSSNELTSEKRTHCGCMTLEKLHNINVKNNTYDLTGEYGIGYTFKSEEFYFDLEDYDKIRDYCWYINDSGYVIARQRKSNRQWVRMHRLVMNAQKHEDVDHIYHKPYDNRKSELRIVNRSQNSMNMKYRSNNTSGRIGVHFDMSRQLWIAHIKLFHQRKHLGYFEKFEDAAKARQEAELKYFGEYRYKEN